MSERSLRYVALGDSYTIGTAVEAAERFPDQLVAALGAQRDGERSAALELVANLGVNGYTTTDLIDAELPALDDLAPGFVTLLIGVNDVVQAVPLERYDAQLVRILDALLAHLPSERIVALTIPDHTVTPEGATYGDPIQRHQAIVACNASVARLAVERGIAVVDIFDVSRAAATDRSLVAEDGLHPSGRQYARWVGRLVPVVRGLLDS